MFAKNGGRGSRGAKRSRRTPSRLSLLRLTLHDGSPVTCATKVAAGPSVEYLQIRRVRMRVLLFSL